MTEAAMPVYQFLMHTNRAKIEKLFDGMPPWTDKDLESVPPRIVSEREKLHIKAIKRVRIQSKKISKHTKKVAEQALCDELNRRISNQMMDEALRECTKSDGWKGPVKNPYGNKSAL